MPNERDAIEALFRRALQPPDPIDVERDSVERLMARAIKRQERREMQRSIRAVFAQLILQLRQQGWGTSGDGTCAECGTERPYHPFWSKLRPQYVTCPRGHRLHVECLDLHTVDDQPGIEARCPRCSRRN